MISRDAWPRTHRNPRLSGLSGSPRTPRSRPSSTVASIPQSVGWQFMGHIVRIVRGPLACASMARSILARPPVRKHGPTSPGSHGESAMRIESLETLHADGGRRAFDFVKVTTDDGLVGWSEYNETFGGAGLTALIERLAPALIGKDPRAHEAHVALMQALRRTSAGGVVQQAIGAIENALLDVKARALGIPVYELLGGPVRDRIRLYWSHCGTYRVGWWQELGLPPLRTLDDVVRLGREVVSRGYTALKTNVMLLGDHAACTTRGSRAARASPSSIPTGTSCRRAATSSRRSARAPGSTSTSWST